MYIKWYDISVCLDLLWNSGFSANFLAVIDQTQLWIFQQIFPNAFDGPKVLVTWIAHISGTVGDRKSDVRSRFQCWIYKRSNFLLVLVSIFSTSGTRILSKFYTSLIFDGASRRSSSRRNTLPLGYRDGHAEVHFSMPGHWGYKLHRCKGGGLVHQ